MIKAVIIDDEANGRLALREKIKMYCPEVQIIAEAIDGQEGVGLIEQLEPDLVFLDIEMPRMNGFDMLTRLGDRSFQIIFTTAYNHHAIKAIKYSAFDYLLKPIDIEELKTAVSKLGNTQKKNVKHQLELLQSNIKLPHRQFNKLAISTTEGLSFYSTDQIVHMEASSNYTLIYFNDNTKIVASKNLKEFEEILPSEIFFRIHHSHIINLNYVKRYIRGEGGQIELVNGSYISVSRSKKNDFLKAIGY